MAIIDFSKTHETYGTFADAIHLPDDHTFTDAEIEAMKQQRFDNWVAHIVEMSNRPPVLEDTLPTGVISTPEVITNTDVTDVTPK